MTEHATPRVSAVRVHVGDEELAAVTAVLRSGRLVQGQEVAGFEEEFAALVGGRTCVAVNSGTSALHLGLLAAGVGPGDEVVVPSFTFAATANAVARTGATPVFADIEPDSFCLDPAAIGAAVTPRTAAVIPVHLYGHPASWIGLAEVAERHGLLVLEDAAQAHGATYDGTPVGALGDLAAFSFYATKNMTTGEGGMVVCRDEDTARRVRLLRNQGMEERYRNEVAGLNNRMTDLAAAMGRVQLRRLPSWNEERRAVAATYDEQLVGVVTPTVAPKTEPVWHQYTVRSEDRDALAARLDEQGIDSAVYYPVPTHRLPAYDLTLDLPETERATREVLSLPIRPGLTEDEVARVVAAVNEDFAVADLRAGLVGFGQMGRHHARVLNSLPGVELVGIADPQPRTDRNSQHLRFFGSVDELVATGVDMAVVSVPTTLHEEVAVELAEAGVHALIEKPVAPDAEAARRIAKAFTSRGLVSCVGHIERYNPALQEMRRRLANGELGGLYQIATRRQGPFPERIADVGVVLDLATHDVDLTAWVAKRPYASLSARTAHRSGLQHEDLVAAVGTLSDGTVVNHLVNWLSPLKERVTVVTGERGTLVADTINADLTFFSNGLAPVSWDTMASFRGVVQGDVIRYAIPKREPLLVELEAFRDAVLGIDRRIVSIEDATHTVEVAEAMLRAAETGQTQTPS